MTAYSQGEVVIVPFPFSDLSDQKLRPALVLLDQSGSDLVLCQITSQAAGDSLAISLGNHDFAQGSLRLESKIRPDKLFTFQRTMVRYRCGKLNPNKTKEVVASLVRLLNGQTDVPRR